VIRQCDQAKITFVAYRDHVHAECGVPAKEAMMPRLFVQSNWLQQVVAVRYICFPEHGLLGGYAFLWPRVPVATGAAFQSKYRREALRDESADQVTACFFGDGAANNQFFECLNMAALWKTDSLCSRNNKWAIGMAHERNNLSTRNLQSRCVWHGGCRGGRWMVAVRAVAEEAVRARAGEGPTLIEALTYRFRGHFS